MSALSCIFTLGLSCLSLPDFASHLTEETARDVVAATEVAPEGRPAWRPEKASQVLLLVQAFYDSTEDLSAAFKQTYWNPSYGSKTRTKGKLRLKKPGKMMWDYHGKGEADYYADGKELVMVEHDTRQAIRTEVEGNSEVMAAMKFLFGGQKLVREFKVRYASDKRAEKYGDAEHYVLELKPKKKQKHYKGLVIVVHASTGRVDAFVVYNHDGSSNYFQFDKVRTNRGLKNDLFQFKLPSGYVETRE